MTTALPRPAQEIHARIDEVKDRDFFGAQVSDLVSTLPFEEARRYLNADAAAGEWEPLLTVEAVTAASREYLTFAAGKASAHRGLSASRSIDHYRAWMWLLGKDGEVDWDDYANYGAPILKRIAELMGWQTLWATVNNPHLERMATGQPCTPGCDEGCAQ